MGYVIFEKHPGDLLQISNVQKQLVTIKIGGFNLKVVGLIKLTAQRTFKVNLEFPTNKTSRDAFIKTMNHWLAKKEILSYNVTD